MKRILVYCLMVLIIFSFVGCAVIPTSNNDTTNENHKKEVIALTDEQAAASAKMLNEKYNLTMDRVFNLTYGTVKVETDGYNRYIVQLIYQYETANRQLKKNDALFYFSYDPQTDKILFERICFWDTYNYGIGDKDGWSYLKNDQEFAWGIDPDALITTNDLDDNFHDSKNNFSDKKTLNDYRDSEKGIDGNVGELITVRGTITQNSGSFPTWCLELDNLMYFQAIDDNGDAYYFNCDKLFFYDTDNLDGIPFSAWESETVTVNGTLENYRSGGNLFLHRPTLVP